MATITERICKDGTSSYRVLIRKKGIYKCNTFKCIKEASAWMAKNDPK